MSVPAPAPHDGNRADLLYLEQARAALWQVMAAGHAFSGRSAGSDVGELAREAMAVQSSQLAAISACLLAWERSDDATVPRPTVAEGPPELHSVALDREFADRLGAHALASLAAASAEMVGGASAEVRAIAQESITAQWRQLAALDSLFPPTITPHR